MSRKVRDAAQPEEPSLFSEFDLADHSEMEPTHVPPVVLIEWEFFDVPHVDYIAPA